ncbi:hypothetical protein [Microbacterium sp. CFBP9034]|uniref:TolB family protein n=1 Tax=Microbacterium sp. CFBP9034 TaxID=3096540 RepID=UPI002A6B862F|nr:hypothetical protein [Microbacterium sp. CFBP9034]MDY0908801.1 hypothetical protein [Microbacterium sp. CFBP9034]
MDAELLPSRDDVLDGQGTIAFSSGLSGDIYFVNPGERAHRVLGTNDDDLDQVCPAFSPDGTRLASGQASGHSQIAWGHPALVITDLTGPGDPSTSTVVPLGGTTKPPCPLWSPDGRWVAFNTSWWPGEPWGTGGVVWIVEAATGEIRRLTEVAAADIEWAPNGAGLYIADRLGIVVYSIATQRMRTIPDTKGSVALTASPDGTTLAVERRRAGSWNQYDLWLIGADGSDRRLVAGNYTHHEWAIGPVWSADGERIVFQRSTHDPAHGGDELLLFRNDEEVVIVTVSADDRLGPVATQSVLRPTVTAEGGEAVQWLPVVVTWAPDSRNLRLVGWRQTTSAEASESWALLAVPLDAVAETTVLWEAPDLIGSLWIHRLNDFQSWAG